MVMMVIDVNDATTTRRDDDEDDARACVGDATTRRETFLFESNISLSDLCASPQTQMATMTTDDDVWITTRLANARG